MEKKDCMHCKNCVLRPMKHQDGVTNTCGLEEELKKLSTEEIMRRLLNDECSLFVEGEPTVSDESCCDD